MKLKEIKPIIESAIAAEREKCARIVEEVRDAHSQMDDEWYCCDHIVGLIRSLPPPSVRVMRPETAVLHPEKITSETLVAGQALVDDKIYDARDMRTPFTGTQVSK